MLVDVGSVVGSVWCCFFGMFSGGVKLCAEVYRVRVVVQCGQALCCDVIA